ncbi:MAG: hypothetical protein P0116_08505 [Candidatus Nitrosocosmicus sp.]|nr:hypothetical protein [Candidatus Nitrosocosmicus sp.]
MFPESTVLGPETTLLPWLEACDCPIPWLAELPPLPLPVPPCCAKALLPLFTCFWKFSLSQDTIRSLPETHCAFWLEACDCPIPWLAELPPLPLPPCCAAALFPVLVWL